MQQHRLLHLLKQAVRYQIEFSRYHPKVVPIVPTYVAQPSASFLNIRFHAVVFEYERLKLKRTRLHPTQLVRLVGVAVYSLKSVTRNDSLCYPLRDV
jgi:hypothetical protein